MRLSIPKIVLIFILILLSFFYVIHRTITPVFFSLAEVEAKKIANKIMHEVVDLYSEQLSYQDMINYIYNDNGDIVMMQPNLNQINSFNSQVSLEIQKRLEAIGRETIKVPLTRILGIEILSAYGPDLSLKMLPVGFTKPPEIVDSFSSAGINQTRHKIYLSITIKVRLMVPFRSKEVDVYADVPVTEVVILGRVPQVYIGLDQKDLEGIIDR
ncbi:MAG: sporulation protein YunB [bacterium]